MAFLRSEEECLLFRKIDLTTVLNKFDTLHLFLEALDKNRFSVYFFSKVVTQFLSDSYIILRLV